MAADRCATEPSPGNIDAARLALRQGAVANSAPLLVDWRGFPTELRRAAVAATQTGAPLSLLMVELAALSRIGQPQGSEGAREPVSELAGAIKAAVGDRGSLARYTEDRLAVIMPESDLGDAITRAEHIARGLASQPRHAAGDELERSAAIGVAEFHEDEALGRLIQRAAEALGRAKLDRTPIVVADGAIPKRTARPGGGQAALARPDTLMPSMSDGKGVESVAGPGSRAKCPPLASAGG